MTDTNRDVSLTGKRSLAADVTSGMDSKRLRQDAVSESTNQQSDAVSGSTNQQPDAVPESTNPQPDAVPESTNQQSDSVPGSTNEGREMAATAQPTGDEQRSDQQLDGITKCCELPIDTGNETGKAEDVEKDSSQTDGMVTKAEPLQPGDGGIHVEPMQGVEHNAQTFVSHVERDNVTDQTKQRVPCDVKCADSANSAEGKQDGVEHKQDKDAQDQSDGIADNKEVTKDKNGAEGKTSVEATTEGVEGKNKGSDENKEGIKDNKDGAEVKKEGEEGNKEGIEDNKDGAEVKKEGEEGNKEGIEDRKDGAEDKKEGAEINKKDADGKKEDGDKAAVDDKKEEDEKPKGKLLYGDAHKKYYIDRNGMLGEGNMGLCYLGYHKTNGSEVVWKRSKHGVMQGEEATVFKEYRIYRELCKGPGMLNVITRGTYNFWDGPREALIMEALGPSLSEFLTFCGGRFSLKTTLMIAVQMLDAIKYVNNHGYVQRDIKLANFVMGIGPSARKVYMVDHGTTVPYVDSENTYLSLVHGKGLTGNIDTISLRGHYNYRCFQRDELESFAYCLVHMLRGSLPWMNRDFPYRGRTQLYRAVSKIKEAYPPAQLFCDLPAELAYVLYMARRLPHSKEPPYQMVKDMMLTLMEQCGWKYDLRYDWFDIRERQGKNEDASDVNKDEDVNSAQDVSKYAGINKDGNVKVDVNNADVNNADVNNADVDMNDVNQDVKDVKGGATPVTDVNTATDSVAANGGGPSAL